MEVNKKIPFTELVDMYPNEWIYLGDPEFKDDIIVKAVLIAHNREEL